MYYKISMPHETSNPFYHEFDVHTCRYLKVWSNFVFMILVFCDFHKQFLMQLFRINLISKLEDLPKSINKIYSPLPVYFTAISSRTFRKNRLLLVDDTSNSVFSYPCKCCIWQTTNRIYDNLFGSEYWVVSGLGTLNSTKVWK